MVEEPYIYNVIGEVIFSLYTKSFKTSYFKTEDKSVHPDAYNCRLLSLASIPNGMFPVLFQKITLNFAF